MNKLIILCFLFFFGCSTFDKTSNINTFKKEEDYNSFTNTAFKLKSLSFGDVYFASNTKEFQKLSPEKKPDFKNIIVYAKAIYDPIYDYYFLSRIDTTTNKKYISIDTTINNSKVFIKISKNIPKEDYQFILKNITSIE